MRVKRTYNFAALFLALLVTISSTGVSVFEHICKISQTRSFSIFSQAACDMDKPAPKCCAEENQLNPKKCCEQKARFSKLTLEGFTEKQVQLKLQNHFANDWLANHFIPASALSLKNYFFDLPPPDTIYQIKSALQPCLISLQTFRC